MLEKSRKLLGLIVLTILVTLLAAGLAYSFPVDLALLSAVDLTTYLDAIIGVYLLATVTKAAPLLHAARQRFRRWTRLGRPRQKRRPRSAARPRLGDDADHPAGVSLCLAA